MINLKNIFSSLEKKFSQVGKKKVKKDTMEDKAKSLERFVEAQAFASVYERALSEVKNGMKVGHWIWYIFPQVKGLGMSYNSHYYGIDGLEEARDYLRHPLLGKRLKEVTTALLELQGKSAGEVFGGLDAMKVRSCMTLFDEVAEDDLFAQVLEKYYHGEKDELTMKMLNPPQRGTSLSHPTTPYFLSPVSR